MNKGGAERGFTLLEVLLALAILAVIVTSIYQSFATSSSTVKQAEKIRDGTDEARTLLDRMTTDIANVYVNQQLAEPTFFSGRKVEDMVANRRYDEIYLTTLTNARLKADEMTLWEVGYYFQERPDENKRVLMRKVLRELPLDKNIQPLEGGREYELTDDVADLRFLYSNDGKTWVDQWDTKQQGRPPKMVEIVLTLADGRVYATGTDILNQ